MRRGAEAGFAALLAASALPALPAAAAPGTPRFEDVASACGAEFRYNFGDFAYDTIPESSGGGVAFLDANSDGRMDLLFLNGRYVPGESDPKGQVFLEAGNRLWLNRGGWAFGDVSLGSGVVGTAWGMAAAVADLDGDRVEDLFLSNYGPNVFLHGNGDGTYRDDTAKLGLAGPEKLHGFTKWSVGAAPIDIDGDGTLELAVANFLAFDPLYLSPKTPERMPSPAEYRGQPGLFYRRGPDGRFVEVAAEVGFAFPENKIMGITAFDCDGDRRVDLFQANDHQPNFLLRNLGGRFEEIGELAGVARNLDGEETGHMHGTVGDVDGDGLLDVFVTDLGYMSLYRATGPCRFEDVTATSGIRSLMSGAESWGAGLVDFDNDGDLDLFAANGAADTLTTKRPTLLLNDGTGRFVDGAGTGGPYFATKRSGRGAAFGDLDDDGRIDVVVSHLDFPGAPAILRNVTDNGNHWLLVKLVSTNGPAEPVGALVRATAGGRTQVRAFQRWQSYLSTNDPRLHFGLGRATKIDRLEVVWPDGTVQTLKNVAVDRVLTVTEPARKGKPKRKG